MQPRFYLTYRSFGRKFQFYRVATPLANLANLIIYHLLVATYLDTQIKRWIVGNIASLGEDNRHNIYIGSYRLARLGRHLQLARPIHPFGLSLQWSSHGGNKTLRRNEINLISRGIKTTTYHRNVITPKLLIGRPHLYGIFFHSQQYFQLKTTNCMIINTHLAPQK